VIILSTVITKPGQLRSIESLDLDGVVDRKLLVAISRAKEQLIVLGSPDALWGSERYALVMRKIQDGGGYIKA
jgi:DNA replication ATP-dependent helicase Dna2